MSRAREEHGFTLVEMVVVCLILGVVLTGITTVFVSGSHAELNLNNRFQAQQAARLALDELRTDAHKACAANIPSSTTLVLALGYQPVVNGPIDLTLCGAAHTVAYPKRVWCVLNSPTVTGQFALYRSMPTTDSSCTKNDKLEADNLTSSAVFTVPVFTPALVTNQIQVEQLQTFVATIVISRKVGTAGAPYTLAQPLALRNSVYEIGISPYTSLLCSATATSTSAICTPGICPYLASSTGQLCLAPAIQ